MGMYHCALENIILVLSTADSFMPCTKNICWSNYQPGSNAAGCVKCKSYIFLIVNFVVC